MDAMLDTIRAAIAPDATDEARAAGATACRTILSALEGTPGQSPAAPPRIDAAAIASAVAALRGVPPDQLLDLAIAKLRAALPSGVNVEPVKPFNVFRVPVLGRG